MKVSDSALCLVQYEVWPRAGRHSVKPHIALGKVLNLILSSSSRVMKPYNDDDDDDDDDGDGDGDDIAPGAQPQMGAK